ncbi:MAG TPA: hypothetical protein ENG21_05475 [Nitrososphaeria archaeon]|nr:hypothetical protein [Nitrososphaeria archaeon]
MSHPTHRECLYFENGFCTLRKIPIPADSPACPAFTPRTRELRAPQQQPMALPGGGVQPNVVQGFMPGLRRRARYRCRHGWGRKRSPPFFGAGARRRGAF